MPPVHSTIPTTHARLKTTVLPKDCDACYSGPYSSKDNFYSKPGVHHHGESY